MPQEEEAGGGCDEVLTILLTMWFIKKKKKRGTHYRKKALIPLLSRSPELSLSSELHAAWLSIQCPSRNSPIKNHLLIIVVYTIHERWHSSAMYTNVPTSEKRLCVYLYVCTTLWSYNKWFIHRAIFLLSRWRCLPPSLRAWALFPGPRW